MSPSKQYVESSADSSGTGTVYFEIPLLEDDEAQTVKLSLATGLTEVNGLKVGDQFTIQLETVVNTSSFPADFVEELFPDGPGVFSDPITFTIKDDSSCPETITPSADTNIVEVPEPKSLTYSRMEQQGIPFGEGYTLDGIVSAANAGNYAAYAATLRGWTWPDGGDDERRIDWRINPAGISSVILEGDAFAYDGCTSLIAVTAPASGTAEQWAKANGYTFIAE